ncbi:MAG TPA: DNA repair protein RecO [Rhizobacter sp.]|nr:DNA repair protein RecO [Rhizobacter sp.]
MATRAPRAPAQLAAYVLHRYDWSESSLILDLFTREQGRLAVIAKGAKRPYSQLRSVLLPFQRAHVVLGRPPKADATGEATSDVQTLRGAEWAGGQAMLTGAALFSGFYLNELLMKLLPRGDAHAALFDIYAGTLSALGANDEAALRAFEVSLLSQLGLLPDLSLATLTQEAVDAERRYTLLAEAGVSAPRPSDTAVAGQVLIGLQAALEHGSLPALQQACARALPELKTLLRSLLHYHLGSPVLRTRQVMLDVQALDR